MFTIAGSEHPVKACADPYTDDDRTYYCTRLAGHDGPHRACGVTRHNYAEWTDDESDEPDAASSTIREYSGGTDAFEVFGEFDPQDDGVTAEEIIEELEEKNTARHWDDDQDDELPEFEDAVGSDEDDDDGVESASYLDKACPMARCAEVVSDPDDLVGHLMVDHGKRRTEATQMTVEVYPPYDDPE